MTAPSTPADPTPRHRWNWKPKLRWFAAEYLIVVLGVLTAVALNRWNEGLQDRGHEQQYLQELVQDLEADELELEENRARAMARAKQIREIMEAVGTAEFLRDYEVVVEWPNTEQRERCHARPLACLVNVRVFDGSQAVYRELTQSGQLRVIRDRQLVSALTRYYAMVEARKEGHLNILRPTNNQLAEAMHERGLSWASDEPDLFDTFVSSVRRSPELRSRLHEVYVSSHYQVYDIDTNHQPALDSLMRLVRAHVGS